VQYQLSKKRSQHLFGFMAIDGVDVLEPTKMAKSADFIRFLEQIRAVNYNPCPIGLVLDNARIHKSKITIQAAIRLNIHLLYLPPYSPSLNPIEFAWKDGKRKVSRITDFEEAIEEAPSIFFDIIEQRKHSYSKNWVNKFILSDSY
jgi:transposase